MDTSAELDRLWNLPRGENATTDLLGWGMNLADGASFVSQYREIFVSEAYSFSFDGTCPTIVDGGANIGMASIWWLARWPSARIVAFEPDPDIFALLSHNLRHQKSHAVELRRAALSTHSLGNYFLQDGADGGRLAAARLDAEQDRILVPTQSLSSLLLSLEHVDLLKLDIEGAETDVLVEAHSELNRVDRLFVEYHSFADQGQQLAVLLSLLKEENFRVYAESPMRFMRPFETVPSLTGPDLQLNLWAYRRR